MITQILPFGLQLINKLIPDQKAREEAQHKFLQMQAKGELKELEIRMSAIVAEAKSADPWTSRARPSFLYVFYAIIIFMTVIAPLIGVFAPEAIAAFYANVGAGFNAMPEELWWAFTAGYLGYAGARSYDKKKQIEGLPWRS